jgi:hypothetical protein
VLRTAWTVARYLGVVAVHKWAIVVAGREVNRALPAQLRVSLRRLVLHDLSKLSRAELMPYARHFAKPKSAHGERDAEFEQAWRHHYEHNDHHPEHFDTAGGLARMPDPALVEMVIDWMAASRAYEGSWPCCGGHWRWLEHSWDRLRLHPSNKALAGAIVCVLGYATAIPAYDWDAALRDLDERGRAQLHELRSLYAVPRTRLSERFA